MMLRDLARVLLWAAVHWYCCSARASMVPRSTAKSTGIFASLVPITIKNGKQIKQ